MIWFSNIHFKDPLFNKSILNGKALGHAESENLNLLKKIILDVLPEKQPFFGTTDITIDLNELEILHKEIEHQLKSMLAFKSSAPVSVPSWVIEKWHRDNPGTSYILFEKEYKLNLKLKKDSLIHTLVKFYRLINFCIDDRSPMIISIEK